MKIPGWVKENLPTAARLLRWYLERRQSTGTMRKAGAVVALVFLIGCAGITLPPCLKDGTLCLPSPSPTAPPSVEPSLPPPSPEASPTPGPDPTPPASPSPVPTVAPPPTPPPPTPPPCVQEPPAPLCVPGCVSCAEWIAGALAGEDWRPLPGSPDLIFNPAPGIEGRDCIDRRTCDLVWCSNGQLRAHRLQKDGSVCQLGCKRTAPTPCPPSPPPGPQASPTPPPSGPGPAQCPPLVRWGGGLHAQMTPQFEGIPKVPTIAGNTIDFDSTARFGSGRGQPCNDEHHEVCSAPDGSWRRCEDPRGPVWTVVRGCGRDTKIINEGWGFRVQRVEAGKCVVRICPRSDVQDAEGKPVRVVGDACSEAEADVR